MEYITHLRFKGKDLTGKPVLITRGKKLIRKDNYLYFEDRPICVYRSDCARKHFSINEDKNGMLRGDLIEKIAYSNKKFEDNQANLLWSDKWNKFLNLEHDVIIFADCFFEADISELQELYNELYVK